ncbi:uncharacterized protein ASPGLDRAFT_30362 [Aspergillus glaucus CBS 516.65]|uniref:Uncharacterized protein n=1 Tax=Aspergillus glaucus CBS 516.65 TaxID=1160497 RepID=A0A1L9V4T5_ASPGL|nr:hypothetical protein ASPGLDRAFT_30362 [Aspergillus glaucus CBS 516.65]OJJ78869.1 hypothetical protein ASPGLDRAFT_30362 [Aspergillus glaucus CBS 516.65]
MPTPPIQIHVYHAFQYTSQILLKSRLDANTHANTVFTTTLERGPKRIPLPPPLNTDKPTVLSTLQNHTLLKHCIWPDSTTKSTDPRVNTSIFNIHYPNDNDAFKASFVNIDSGVSVLEEHVIPGVNITVCWKVVGSQNGIWYLEENAWLECSFLMGWIYKLRDGYLPKTQRVLALLERVAQGDRLNERVASAAGRVRYVEPVKRKTSALPSVDHSGTNVNSETNPALSARQFDFPISGQRLDNGAYCNTRDICKSFYCNNERCATNQCKTTEDCGGYVCSHNNRCIDANLYDNKNCEQDKQCRSDKCTNGKCTPGTGYYNARCSSARECNDGLICRQAAYLGDGQRACLDPETSGTGQDEGAPCGRDSDCKRGLECKNNSTDIQGVFGGFGWQQDPRDRFQCTKPA